MFFLGSWVSQRCLKGNFDAFCALTGPVAAGMVNRFGCRAVGFGGTLVATVSVFVSAFMPSIELMIVSYGIFAGKS